MSGSFKYRIPINILTPIYIGSIDSFNANEYLFLNDKVYRINIVNFFNTLNDKNKEKFIKRVEDENFSLSDLEYIDVDLLKSFSRYSLINKCSSYPNNNNVQIECGVKSQNKLYIPGSSIKGAIRAALFYNAVQFEQIPNIINKILLNNYHNIINDYFATSEDSNIYFNIMRFLQVEDSSGFNETPHIHELVKLESNITRGTMIRRSLGTRYLETIPESNTLNTVITTNYDKDFFKELNFDEDIEDLLSMNKISEALFSFADDFIDFEINFFSKFNRYDLVKFYEELMEQNYYNKPLILLGGGLGMHARTIYLKIVEYDVKNNTHFSENVSRLLFKRSEDNVFPRSRNVTYENSKPFGWAQLDFSEYI